MDDLHYGHFGELVESGFAYLKGELSLGLFEETVNRVLSALRDGEGKFKAIDLPPELKAELHQDLAKIEEGFKLFEEGIEKIRKFIEDKDKNILWEGLCLTKLGCDYLNEVMRQEEERLHNEDGTNPGG